MRTPRLGTIAAACAVIGGDRPISPATYYRGVKNGFYPKPDLVGRNIARVNLDLLDRMLTERMAERSVEPVSV